MLFFKQKQKTDELLPPPPPYSDLELEEEIKEKPKFFDEIVKPKKAETIPEEDEFGELVRKVEGLKPRKVLKKSVKATPKKKLTLAKQKIPIKTPKQPKKVEIKELKRKIKTKKLAQSKPIKKGRLQLKKTKAIKRITKISKIREPKLEDLGLRDIDFGLPKGFEEQKKEFELPDTLEDFDTDELGKELEQKTEKPREILEAEEEIQSAIEKIKNKEIPSFLSRLFLGKEKGKNFKEVYPTFSIPRGDGLSIIQSNIKKARDALMRFDLETAKKKYIEIMRIYNGLNAQDKAKVYHGIQELYFDRKNAEELKV